MPLRYARLSVALFGLCALFAALALFPSVTRADDAATETLELQPGNNFVGWVAEPIAVADIFEQVPDAKLIYTWSADSRSWRYAISEVGGNLETLDSGMAAVIWISGSDPVEWERPLTPAKGMVTLYSGENWVTWNGRDEWPLDQVARGIGTSLDSIEVRGQIYEPDTESTIPPIRRGDALRVTVDRDLSWLQPTGMMPNIEWIGEYSKSLQDEIAAAFRLVLDFFAEQFAVETDFSNTTVLLYSSIDAAVKYAESSVTPQFGYRPDVLRVRMMSGRLAEARPWGFFMSACGWQPQGTTPCHGRTVETVTHEWFHHLQGQLSAQQDLLVSPIWMIEGQSTWAEWHWYSWSRNEPYDSQLERRLNATARTRSTLESVEYPYSGMAYLLGSIAAERLAQASDPDAHIEYNRQLAPQSTVSTRRWARTSDWRAAFEEAFGLTTTEFYREFEAWRETLPTPSQQYDYDLSDEILSGVLHHSNGVPASGFRVEATTYVDGVNVDLARTAIVDGAGNFAIELAPETRQRIEVTRDGCRLWLTDDGLSTTYPQSGSHWELDTRSLPQLNLTLPSGACENELRISVVRLLGDDRYINILLLDAETDEWTAARSGRSGTYVGHAPKPGEYRVRVRLDGCGVFYSEHGVVASRQDSDVLRLSDEPITIEVRIPSDLCVLRIAGQIRYENGIPASGIGLYVSDGGVYSSTTTDPKGQFDVAVGDSGDYMLSFGTDVAGCRIRYSESGATTEWDAATRITVADSDFSGIEFVVPDDPASLCE